MRQFVKIVAGLIFLLFSSLWAALVLVATLVGIATVPANADPLKKAAIATLNWLAGSNHLIAYLLALVLAALGVGLLFWHPEKGWRWFFDRTGEAPPREATRHGAITFIGGTPPTPPLPEPQDVIDAKLRLGNFVLVTLGPAIESANLTLRKAANVVMAIDPNSPQANFAYNGIVSASVSPGILRVFDSAENVRGSSLPVLEGAIQDAVGKYCAVGALIADIVMSTRSNSEAWENGGFREQCAAWLSVHDELESKLQALSADIHYSQIRAHMRGATLLDHTRRDWLRAIEILS